MEATKTINIPDYEILCDIYRLIIIVHKYVRGHWKYCSLVNNIMSYYKPKLNAINILLLF